LYSIIGNSRRAESPATEPEKISIYVIEYNDIDSKCMYFAIIAVTEVWQ